MDPKDAATFLTGSNVTELSPATSFALDQTLSKSATTATIGGRSRKQVAEEQFISETKVPGVPLDIKTGASTWERLMLDARINRKNQIKYLEDKYGPGTVRESKQGDLIVRVPDPETGKSKDLMVNPRSEMSLGDFMSLISVTPEIGGWIWAERAGKAIPKLGKAKGIIGGARDIAAGTIGAETVGAVKDIGFNVYDRQTLDISAVGRQRGQQALLDVGVGAVAKPIAAFFQWLKNPMHGYRGQVQFDALEAQKYFKEKYGVSVPLTVGESTGSPLFARSEVFVEKMPGGSEPIREIKRRQETQFRKLQQLMMGDVASDEEFGQRAIAEIQSKIEPVTKVVAAATESLAGQAQSQISGIVGKVTLPERQVYKSKLGEDVRAAIIGKRNAVKAESDKLYEIVKSMPGGEGKVFDATGLQNDFKSILKSLPSPERTVQKPSSLIDQFGNEIKSTSKTMEPLREFVPPNILTRLESVIGLKDAKFSLSDLQQMRREVYDDIAKGEGVPGLGTHYLADVGEALTKAIDRGVSSLPTSELKDALQLANKHYREKVVPFNRQGLTELFRNADEPGSVADSEVVSRILGGQKAVRNWQLVKETLGENSVEFNRIRRAAADNIIEASRLPGEETIDAKSFAKSLSDAFIKYPEIYEDVFKGRERDLFKQAKFLGYAQGDKINADELQRLMTNPNPTAEKLRNLVLVERKRDELYKNKLVKSIGDGTLSEQTLKPTEFVNRVLETAEPKEVDAVVKLLEGKPELLQDLRQKTFEKVFKDAARQATAEDVNRIISGENTHILSGVSLASALKNPSYRQKIETILGKEGFNDLTQYIKLQTAPEKAAQSFASAGGLAAGAQIASLERRGVFAYLSDAVRNFVFATILSRPPLRTWLTRLPEEPGKWSLIFSSPPFLEAVTKEFGEGTAAQSFMQTLKSAVDRTFSATPAEEKKPPSTFLVGPDDEKRKFWESQLTGTGTTNQPTKPPVP